MSISRSFAREFLAGIALAAGQYVFERLVTTEFSRSPRAVNVDRIWASIGHFLLPHEIKSLNRILSSLDGASEWNLKNRIANLRDGEVTSEDDLRVRYALAILGYAITGGGANPDIALPILLPDLRGEKNA